MKTRSLLALGSNLGGRAVQLARALAYINESAPVYAVSSVYATQSMLKDEQPRYFNMVAAVYTNLSPEQLLFFVKSIERRMGRVKRGHWGARIIDIDIIDHNGSVIDLPCLTVPHPAMGERSFVLEPLAEIEPGYVHPVTGKSIDEMRAGIHDTLGITRIGGVVCPY